MFEQFGKKRPGDSLSAEHVNLLTALAEKLGMVVIPANVGYARDGRSTSPPPMFRQGLFEVTGISDETEDGESSGSSSSSSSESSSSGSSGGGDAGAGAEENSDIYLIKPRYYDLEALEWRTNEAEGPWELDATALDVNFSVGDIIVAFWHPQRVMWVPIKTATAGGGLEVLFEICEACCEECWADVIILSKSTTEDVPGMGATVTQCGSDATKTLNPTQIRVYDVAGCFLTEPNELLVGRRGYASYMHQQSPLKDCSGEDMELLCGLDPFPTPRWEIKSLCCYQNQCDEGYGYT